MKLCNIQIKLDSNEKWDRTSPTFIKKDPLEKLETFFSAPEQITKNVGHLADRAKNFIFGKIIVLILLPWETAWGLLAHTTIVENLHKLKKNKKAQRFLSLIKDQLEVIFIYKPNRLKHNCYTNKLL